MHPNLFGCGVVGASKGGRKMEGKTLAKDEEKEELLLLEKILEIEKAYFDLMKAYSSCLTTLNVKERDYFYKPFWLTPKIVRYRIGQHVNFLQEVFLSLIAQNRDKIDSKIIKKFELYCEDMNKFSVQVTESGLKTLFYNMPSAIITGLTGLTGLVGLLTTAYDMFSTKDSGSLVFSAALWIIIATIFLLFSLVIRSSIRRSDRVLHHETDVQEKQEKIFITLQEYLEFI